MSRIEEAYHCRFIDETVEFYNGETGATMYPLSVAIPIADTTCSICQKPLLQGERCIPHLGGEFRGPNHLECERRYHAMIRTPTLAQQLGLSSYQVLRILRMLGIQPGRMRSNPINSHLVPIPLWPPELVEQLQNHPEVIASRERSQKRGTHAKPS